MFSIQGHPGGRPVQANVGKAANEVRAQTSASNPQFKKTASRRECAHEAERPERSWYAGSRLKSENGPPGGLMANSAPFPSGA
jgi:hypothetical protein